MADIQSYERVLKTKRKSRGGIGILAAVLCVASLLGVWIYVSLALKLNPTWVALVPILLITIVFILRKYSQVEYEYSFTSGYFTYSKIYGKSRRKAVCEIDIRTVTEVIPYDQNTSKRLTNASSVIKALPEGNAQNPCVCVFEEKEQIIYLIFDCDAQTAKIFKYFNPRATSNTILSNLKSTCDNNSASGEN